MPVNMISSSNPDWLHEDLRTRAAAAFPTLGTHDGWRGREDQILLQGQVR